MSNELESGVKSLINRLFVLAVEDRELRSVLRRLATSFLASTEESAGAAASGPANAVAEPAVPFVMLNPPVAAPDRREQPAASESPAVQAEPLVTPAKRPERLPARPPEPLPELTLGRSRPAEPARPIYELPKETVNDFAIIEARCRLKAEGSRWTAARRRQIADGNSFETAIEPKDRDIISRAKSLPGCFLWMCHSSGPSPSNLALYEDVAGCFEAMAEAVSLVAQIQAQPDIEQTDFAAALDLLAEAQSALRMAVHNIDGAPDTDQTEVFRWLKQTGYESQIFIKRFMRIDDPADPGRWPDILARVEAIEGRVQDTSRRRNQRKKLLGKVRHKANLIVNDPAKAADQWAILIETVRELVAGGLPPSNRELRELLIPVIELLPEQGDLPQEFDRVLREIDNFLATCPPPEAPAVVKLSQEVQTTARLLRGRSLVLIGGDKRQAAYQAIKDAFGVKELIWIETRAHESFEGFGPFVARPDVAAVLLAIRWSSHSYGEVKGYCDLHDKPLIRLPGGYNPNQVAAQIIAQASDRLQ